MIVGLIAGIGVAFSGHMQAEHLMESQPMKMAASEALWDDSGDPAAWTALRILIRIKKKHIRNFNSLRTQLLGLPEVQRQCERDENTSKEYEKRTEKATISRLSKRRSGVSALWRERARL